MRLMSHICPSRLLSVGSLLLFLYRSILSGFRLIRERLRFVFDVFNHDEITFVCVEEYSICHWTFQTLYMFFSFVRRGAYLFVSI